jgi:hypothetical protein
MKRITNKFVRIGLQSRKLAPVSRFATGFVPAVKYMSTEKPGALNIAAQSLKGRRTIAERNTLATLREAKEALDNHFKTTYGFSIQSIFHRLQFGRDLKDPTKTAWVAAIFTNAKGKMGGLWGDYSIGMRKKNFSIPKLSGQHWDHGVPVEDVSLKLMIHSMRHGLPTKEIFKQIWYALNANENIRVLDEDVHTIFNEIDKHKVAEGGNRLISIQEKILSLNANDKKKLIEYLIPLGKNIGEVQTDYCNKFTDRLLRTEVGYLVDFANDFKDFYLNHRLIHIQRGGAAKFDTKEEILMEILLKMIGSSELMNTVANENRTIIENTNDMEVAYKNLKEMVHTMNTFFKEAKRIYESPNTYITNGSSTTRSNSNRRVQLMGGRTLKRRK